MRAGVAQKHRHVVAQDPSTKTELSAWAGLVG